MVSSGTADTMLERCCRDIDKINEWTGRIVSWLVIPITFIVATEVILRYLFNRPTIWAYDVNTQLLATLSILGGGYVLLHGGHIRMDLLIDRLSRTRRGTIEVVSGLIVVFTVGILLWKTSEQAWFSLQTREIASTFFHPPLYPLRAIIAIGVLLLLLQLIAKLVRDILIIMGSRSKGD